MTASDPAHPPRPGEGTGPLPQIASPPPSPHSTGPLPPLPAGVPETPLVKALRKNLPAINDGRKSLRAGLSEIVISLMAEADMDMSDPITGEDGEVVLQEIPDVILRYWLSKVTSEQITFETFLGAIIAEGFAIGYKKILASASREAQTLAGTDPDLPSPLAVLNLINQFDSSSDEIKVSLAEAVALNATNMLKGGLDAQTANHLVQLLQSVAQ